MPTCTRAICSSTTGPHRRRRFRHHGAARPKERRFLAEILYGFITPRLQARRGGAFRGGLRAAQSFGRAVRAGLARHRRADHGPAGERDLHGAAARPAVPISPKCSTCRRGRNCCCCKRPWWWSKAWPHPRSRAQYVDGVRAGGEGMDGADQLGAGGAVRGGGAKGRPRAAASWATSRSCWQAERTADALSDMAEERLAARRSDGRAAGRGQGRQNRRAGSASGSALSRWPPSPWRCSFDRSIGNLNFLSLPGLCRPSSNRAGIARSLDARLRWHDSGVNECARQAHPADHRRRHRRL